MDQWPSYDSIFGVPELTGTNNLLKRKKAILQLHLSTPTSDHDTLERIRSSGLKKDSNSLEFIILSSFTYPHAVPNLYDFLFSVEHRFALFHIMKYGL